MSDLMLHGKLNMPLPDEPQDCDVVTWVQFKAAAKEAADRIEELEAENHLLKTSGIVEVAARNPNVMEYMRHWEGRTETAEAKLHASAMQELAALGQAQDAHQTQLEAEAKLAASYTSAEVEAAVEKTMLGLTLRAMTAQERADRGVPPGVEGLLVVKVDETSEAHAKGLRPDDVITEAAQSRLSTLADLEARIAEARDAGRRSILLLIRASVWTTA